MNGITRTTKNQLTRLSRVLSPSTSPTSPLCVGIILALVGGPFLFQTPHSGSTADVRPIVKVTAPTPAPAVLVVPSSPPVLTAPATPSLQPAAVPVVEPPPQAPPEAPAAAPDNETPPPAPVPRAPAVKRHTGSGRDYAASLLSNHQFSCLDAMWERESGWDATAKNPSSGAYGIPQALPGSKMASAGSDWRTNPATQVDWGLSYINATYGSPCGAWAFWQSHHWY